MENQTAKVLNELIAAFMHGGEAAALAYVAALDPVLYNTPILGWLEKEAIHYLAQFLTVSVERLADSVVIDVQTNKQDSDVVSAGVALSIAEASGDKKAIAENTERLKRAYKAAFNFDGWAVPVK